MGFNGNGFPSINVFLNSFIGEFQNKVDWDEISKYHVLSELFISAYKDKVKWHLASQYQDLSYSFIQNFDFIAPMDEAL